MPRSFSGPLTITKRFHSFRCKALAPKTYRTRLDSKLYGNFLICLPAKYPITIFARTAIRASAA